MEVWTKLVFGCEDHHLGNRLDWEVEKAPWEKVEDIFHLIIKKLYREENKFFKILIFN